MEKERSYNEAFLALQAIVEEIEDDTIMLDTLNEKVKEANELIAYCEKKLRGLEGELKQTMGI